MTEAVANYKYPCQAKKLMKEMNDFTYSYAYKYPEYKNPENLDESLYDLANTAVSQLTQVQKDVLIRLYNAYCISPQYVTGDEITDADKVKVMQGYQDEFRTLFHREEERIICTEIFRRLQYKTQVMVNSASDDQRTRLLHSLEVQKNARKIAIALNANYELAETIAIAHDIGHAPFGHAGESAINQYLENHWAGAFSHALQSVKVIDFLCSHRALKPKGLMGLGVSDLVLEGVLKHDSDSFTNNLTSARYKLQYDCPTLYKPVGIANSSDYADDTISIGGLETQIVCWADKIAYMGHDWEEFVAVDLLEVMLSRVNAMVIKLGELSAEQNGMDTFVQKYRHVPNVEKTNLRLLNDGLGDLQTAFESPDYACNSYSIEDTFVDKLNALIEVCEKVIEKQKEQPSEFLLFSKEQYKAFCAFFKITASWMTITLVKPKRLGAKVDVIFAIYKYLTGTTSHRTVPALIGGLVKCSAKYLASIQSETADRDSMIQLCNKNWRLVEAKHRGDTGLKSKLRKCFAVHFDDAYTEATEYINSFIGQEFIHSTRVRYMTQKAEMIILKLMAYYHENHEMLPIKCRNRIELEMNLGTNLSKTKELLKEYYRGKSEEASVPSWLVSKVGSAGSSNNEQIKKRLIDLIDTDDSIAKEVIKLRVIADYVSGMTDRMAEMKYNEICSSDTQWSRAYSERGTFNL